MEPLSKLQTDGRLLTHTQYMRLIGLFGVAGEVDLLRDTRGKKREEGPVTSKVHSDWIRSQVTGKATPVLRLPTVNLETASF